MPRRDRTMLVRCIRVGRLSVLIGAGLLMSSCASPPPSPPVTDPPPAVSRPAEPRKRMPAQPKRPPLTPEMQDRLARLHLMLLEREAQLQHLEKKLDEAIQETVRSKAKLASQESRAEAASNLAEAEVALKTLKASAKGVEKRPDYVRVAQLMAMSAEELKKENYGGSLYLTNQLKSQLRDLQDRLESEQEAKTGGGATALPAGADPDARVARLQALLDAKDAQVRAAEKKLDDTIHETVRTKAKLRSQENKAEAASNLAEAEGALGTLKEAFAGVEKQQEFVRATELAAMSADALKKENYSGSLYVANQSKAIVKDLQERLQARAAMPLVEGEVSFVRPVSLKVAAAGKIREQPASEAAVAWAADRGATVTGHAYKGSWIHVQGDDNRWGWIFYDLLPAP